MLGKSVDFLIDSGAECSLIPSNFVPSTLITPSSINLTGVNGSPLSVQGVFSTSICVPQLRREYPVNFVVTNLCPILGADFIANARLQLDMHAKLLFDVDTSLSAELKPSDSLPTQVRVTNSVPHALEKFPILTTAPDYHVVQKDGVRHHIETTGGPIHFKPRPLNPEKYKAAKEEFDKLLRLGIVRRSSSSWASPLHMVRKGDGTWRPCGDFRALKGKSHQNNIGPKKIAMCLLVSESPFIPREIASFALKIEMTLKR